MREAARYGPQEESHHLPTSVYAATTPTPTHSVHTAQDKRTPTLTHTTTGVHKHERERSTPDTRPSPKGRKGGETHARTQPQATAFVSECKSSGKKNGRGTARRRVARQTASQKQVEQHLSMPNTPDAHVHARAAATDFRWANGGEGEGTRRDGGSFIR